MGQRSKLGTTVAAITVNTWVHTVPTLLCPAPGGLEPWGVPGLGSPGRSANAKERRSPARGRTRTKDSQRVLPAGPGGDPMSLSRQLRGQEVCVPHFIDEHMAVESAK